jgi:hypothetical protein
MQLSVALRLRVVVPHPLLVVVDEQPRGGPPGRHHGGSRDAVLLGRGIVHVHLRLSLARDDALAQLTHGDLGSLLGHRLQRDHGCVVADRAQAAMAAPVATTSTVLLATTACILPTATSAATAAASSITASFALKGGHLLLHVLPDQLHGPHLHLLRRLAGEAPPSHLADRRVVGDLVAMHD